MVTLNVCGLAHGKSIGFGVKRQGKVPLIVLFIIDGDQVPDIPFGEINAKIGAVVLIHMGEMAAKFGANIVVQAVLQVVLSAPTQVIPLGDKLKVTD
jgi:hypothetical protein